MADRSFAAWVKPIAAQLRESRAQIVDVARTIPTEAWGRPSPNEGWTNGDLLVHLAVGDWVCQTVLTAVTTNTPLDVGEVGRPDWIREGNATRLEERQERTVEELIAEVEVEGEETQELLSLLTDGHESLRPEGAPMSLGDYLHGFPGHDRDHLAQLRRAAEKKA